MSRPRRCYEIKENASAIFDGYIGRVRAVLAYERGLELCPRYCFAFLVFDHLDTSRLSHVRDRASEIGWPKGCLRSALGRFHRLFYVRQLLPLIREPMVDLLIRPFTEFSRRIQK